MKENNEVMQGDNTARGPSTSGADLSVGAVLSVLKEALLANASDALDKCRTSKSSFTDVRRFLFARRASKDTKKLNAGVAIIALQNIDEQGGLSEDQLLARSLSERLTKTALYKGDGTNQEQAIIQQAFALIEEYLKEQGV